MTVPQDLADATVAELVAGFRSGAFSPVEATKAALARIGAKNASVNAYVYLDRAGALDAAQRSEQRWRKGIPLSPIDGVTASVKELQMAKAWPLRRCSRATDPDTVSDEDASTVANLRHAGAVLLGKTNSPEFGWKGTTDNFVFGTTANPWNSGRTAGGSSGGAAAAAALGMGTLHLGTDGGGSVRIPASFCGVFGLKPSFGRVPVYPLSKFGTTSHVGPIARTVADGARMLNVLKIRDHRDWHGLPPDRVDYATECEKGVAGLRIGYSCTLGFAEVDLEIADIVSNAAESFSRMGACVEQVDKVMDDPTEMFRIVWAAGMAGTARMFPAECRNMMDPGFVRLAEFAEQLPLPPYLDAEYARGLLGAQMNAFHEQYDLLLTPTEPIAAFDIALQVARPDQQDWIDWTPFTFPFNLTGQPAATVPCGWTADGLPVGLQVVGPRYRDDLVLRACRSFEQSGLATRPPALPA